MDPPPLLYLGFKWDLDDGGPGTVSRYLCYPRLTLAGILGRLSHIYDGHQDRTSWQVAETIITHAAQKSPASSFIYVEVSEEDSPRRSFDINLNPSACRLATYFEIKSIAIGSLFLTVAIRDERWRPNRSSRLTFPLRATGSEPIGGEGSRRHA
jgi:hypothetical protein